MLQLTNHNGFPVVKVERKRRKAGGDPSLDAVAAATDDIDGGSIRSLESSSGSILDGDATPPFSRDLRFAGIILRKQLLSVLVRGADRFLHDPPATPGVLLPGETPPLNHDLMEGTYPSYPSFDAAFAASRGYEDRWLDLTPYMNPTPVVIRESAPFPRAFSVFRNLGLRHLVVVDKRSVVVGILTRHECTDHHLKHILLCQVSMEEESLREKQRIIDSYDSTQYGRA